LEPVAIYGKVPNYGDGYGHGSGYGDGDGYGHGSGYGDGDGYGHGYGHGSGSGSGYGDGDGYGHGYGHGSGSGSGSGYGHGDGHGDGSGYLKEATLGFIEMLPCIRRTRAKKLLRQGAKIAYWKSDIRGNPSNGGKAEPVSVGTVQKIDGPLKICTAKALHATYLPSKWTGERIWLVALKGEVIEQEDKLGALEREILAELTGGKLQ
jgi:hypothetical protein